MYGESPDSNNEYLDDQNNYDNQYENYENTDKPSPLKDEGFDPLGNI
jgi:hypothetical protein